MKLRLNLSVICIVLVVWTLLDSLSFLPVEQWGKSAAYCFNALAAFCLKNPRGEMKNRSIKMFKKRMAYFAVLPSHKRNELILQFHAHKRNVPLHGLLYQLLVKEEITSIYSQMHIQASILHVFRIYWNNLWRHHSREVFQKQSKTVLLHYTLQTCSKQKCLTLTFWNMAVCFK